MDSSVVSNSSDVPSSSSILYELLVYAEWKQQPELPKLLTQNQEGFGTLIKSALVFKGQDGPPEQLERLLSWQQPWRLCVGDGGKVVAIMQDATLEIRSSRDEYSSVIAKASLPKDPFHQWRRWCWSPDCTMLALGFSNGTIRVYDLMGSNLFSICPPESVQEQFFTNTSDSFASCFFLKAQSASHKWSNELVAVDYKGHLRSYLVSPTEGFQENHSFSFSTFYRSGITAVAYHPAHPLLYVAGPVVHSGNLQLMETGDRIGLTAWRILNDHPFYQIVHHDKKSENLSFSNSFWRVPFFGSKYEQSALVRLEVSPLGKRIAALHSCGGVSIWSLPGIKLQGFWPLDQQPDWNVLNPLTLEVESPNSKRPGNKLLASNESFYPVDLDWWSDEALVLVRNSGSVSVCETANLLNLLGESPEFLAGSAQVRRLHNEKGFLALECDVDVCSKSRLSDETIEDDSFMEISGEEGEEEMPTTLFQRVTTILNAVAYLVTDMERFRPRRKRLRLCRRTYRLLALRSTTPEELYSRKLDNEDYGEALTLAHTYNLDCDLVYQRQWRNNKVSVATIRDYLSKVSNQTWVLRECLDRVPESLLAARELIEFGLKATSKEAFRNLGTKRKIKDFDDITEKQKEFLQFRHTLLRYQDRLIMYEKILGGLQLADELFEHSVYADFRSSSSLRACVQFARAANCQAVECMLTYHGCQTLQHWLPIISNFPETVCPTEYKSLLPELASDGVVFSWQESQLRDLDWSEKDLYGNVNELQLDTPDMDNKLLYELEPGLSAYRIPVRELTPKLIQQWYLERVRAIERSSRMVDNALVLLRLAQDNNIEGLSSLHQELQVLDALVYELFLEDMSLADLEKKSPLEKCKLLMCKTTDGTFTNDMSRLLLPFLDRIEREQPGLKFKLLHDYLTSISRESLSLALKFFEGQEELSCGLSPDELSSLAVDCIYSYVETEDLHLAQRILAAIPVQRVLSVANTEQLDVLESEIAGSLILHRNGTPKSLGYIKDNKHDMQTVSLLLTRLARTVANSNPSATEAEWSSLLSDILDLQRTVFDCLPIHTCYEILCSTLLSSGNLTSIKLAGSYVNSRTISRTGAQQQGESQISEEKSIDLILTAAREYMDSAGTLTDPAMELARACLHLLHTENPDIQEERNLLSAFHLLNDFGIKILPIQVRLSPNRLRLVEDCLKKKAGAHRNPSKLLQLAAYLNICGENASERQGCVLVLVAETAFLSNDYRSCADTCNRLISANYTNGWGITSKLAKCSQFKDLPCRFQLLSFALQHCPPDVLQELIDIRRSLEVESLQEIVKKQIVMHNSSLSSHLDGQSINTHPESFGLDFLQSIPTGESSVQETTQRLLKRVGDSQFWKKALRIGWDESVETDLIEELIMPQEYHVCHAFYSSLYDSTAFCASKLGYRYNRFSAPDVPPQLQLEQALLRLTLLEQESGSDQLSIPNVLTECALSLLPEDNCLGLGFLLSLPDSHAKEASHRVFDANISTVTLQLAQYHAALRWYRNSVGGNKERLNHVVFYKPLELISLAAQAKSHDKTWQNELFGWRAKQADYIQAQDLLTLDCGVDINRFSSDDQYRQDSILGLAMNDDSEKLRFALALASRHGVDRSQVIAEHISNLLLSDLSVAEVNDRLSKPELKDAIEEAKDTIKEKLESSVFPIIDGKQLDLLELYFSVLNLTSPVHRSERLLPKDHLKLLSKVKATTAGLDYKLLISGPKYTIKAVESCLTVDNIPMVAKLLKAMPEALACSLTASQLYAVFLRQQLQMSKLVPVKNLTPILSKIKPKDLIQVIESAYFSKTNTSSTVCNEQAEELLAAALLNCDFSESEHHMEQLAGWKEHIRSSRWLIETWPNEACSRGFFNTFGDKNAIRDELRSVFISKEKPIELLLDLVKAAATACSVSDDTLALDILRSSIESFQKNEGEGLQELTSALARVDQLSLLGKVKVNNEEWDSLLRPLATEEKLPPEERLKVFNILQHTTSDISTEPTLLFSHTKTILASAWPQTKIENKDIETEEKRLSIFLHLVQNTETWQQRDALRSLLDLWPPFSDGSESLLQVAYQLLLNCVYCEDGKWTDQKASYIVDTCNQHPISFNLLEQFLGEVQSKTTGQSDDEEENEDDDCETQVDIQLLILICLLHDDLRAHRKAVSLAQQQLMSPFHDKVAELAINRGLVVDLMTTPAYSDLVTSLLTSEPSSARGIIKTLTQRKHIPEAGSIVLRSINSVPRFMRTFSASIIAGLSGTSPNSSNAYLNIKPPNDKISSVEAINQSSATSASVSAMPNQGDNDWDAAGNDWSDVEESYEPRLEQVVPSSKSSKKEASSYNCKSDLPSETKLSKSDTWSAQDGWDNWSDDELEKIDSVRKIRDKLSEGDFQNKPKCVSPPLLPSPRSAFARVPPREHANVGETNSSQFKEPSPPPSTSGTDWDNDDWDANW